MGLLRQLCHWGPIVALTLISIVIVSANYCSLQLWALPAVVYFRLPHYVLVWAESVWILYQYFHAMRGPGFVPEGWRPENKSDEQYLQYCAQCRSYKAPRSHHCSQCGRCVLKMDHHCPWINACVGHHNHPPFVKFLFFLTIGCIHAIVINVCFLYYLFNYHFLYHRFLPINTVWLLVSISGIAFSFGGGLGVSILLVVQMQSVIKNSTQIEDWITEKARQRRKHSKLPPFVYPYNLGLMGNFTEVINSSGRSKGDGIVWNVAKNCNQYTLTVEQLEQKKEKRKHAVKCEVKEAFAGTRCSTLSQGLCVCVSAPCMERTVGVSKGDIVMVTRWRRRWVYGDIELPETEQAEGHRLRGWIPRHCIKRPTHSTAADNIGSSSSTSSSNINSDNKGRSSDGKSKSSDGQSRSSEEKPKLTHRNRKK